MLSRLTTIKILKRVAHSHASSNSTTFYRRELPTHLSSFTSEKGKSLFRNALAQGNAEIFFSLSGNFTMQSEPAFCGLGSLAMVLNALSVDPGKRWKGVWRWFADDMLECCAPLESIKQQGLTFQQLTSTARCNGLNTVAKRSDQISYHEFLHDLKTVTTSTDTHMVVSFSRKALNQTGDGHFSPVGAFCEETEQVLILDTARFKYPSYFVSARTLYEAMSPIDSVTGLPRGYLILTKGSAKALPLCRISATTIEWDSLTNIFWNQIPNYLAKHPNKHSLKDLLSIVISHMSNPHDFYTSFHTKGYDLAGSTEGNEQLALDLKSELNHLLEEAREHPIYPVVSQVLTPCETSCEHEIHVKLNTSSKNELATLFFLSLPRELLSKLPPDLARSFLQFREHSTFAGLSLLREEVSRMSIQWDSMLNTYCTCGLNTCGKKIP
ncbi:hypothetical protein HDV02_006055 [Globomyces sp. JEL0801]|nr:hypothetical protein HDV02_006055 [Globomyces sp. JEL0801]